MALPGPGTVSARVLVGWDCGVWVYLAMIWVRMVTVHHHEVRQRAMREDENATIVLTVICMATVASVAAIAIELATVKNVGFRAGLGHYAITAATLFGAWFLIPTIFTLHYARLYYGSPASERTLKFTDSKIEPDYWDFLYFAFTIAVASQTADVSLTNRSGRRAVMAQSILAFYFNMAVLGLSINVAAGLLG